MSSRLVTAAGGLVRALGVVLAALALTLAFLLVLAPAGLVVRTVTLLRPRRAAPGASYWRPAPSRRAPTSYLDPY